MMELWGVEVKSGEPVIVTPGEDFMLHLSQAALGLGETCKNGKNNKDSAATLFVKVVVDGKKLVLGTLSPDKIPHLAFNDLVFEKEFELSHNWNNGSVHFTGYKSVFPDHHEEYPFFSVKNQLAMKLMKPAAAASYPKVTKKKAELKSRKRDIDSALGTTSGCHCRPGALGPRERAARASASNVWRLIMRPSPWVTITETKSGTKLVCR